jgi:ParB-like chromosome segregation protein Spo0J
VRNWTKGTKFKVIAKHDILQVVNIFGIRAYMVKAKMKAKLVPIKSIKTNPKNPRVIRDEKFQKLVKSIQEFPKMLDLRPIVVNKSMMVLGGNQRLKACIEAGLKEVPILIADELTKAEQERFIITDNVNFGDWDFSDLNANWNLESLENWGLDIDFGLERNKNRGKGRRL